MGASHVSGTVIPPGYLRGGEQVYLQIKPHQRAFVTLGLLILLGVLGLIWILAFVAAALAYGAVAGVIVAVVLFFLLVLAPLLLIYRARRRWAASWYALTDQRVIVAGTGLSSFSSTATDFPLRIPPGMQVPGQTIYRVKQISVTQGFSGRRGGFGDVVFLAEPSSFVWAGVTDPVSVRTQLEQHFNMIQEAQYEDRGKREAVVQAQATAAAHDSVMRKCEWCGSISAWPWPDDKCPQCRHAI